MNPNTHSITITMTGRYPDGAEEFASVVQRGNGELQHWISVFQAILVAAKFPPEVAASIKIKDE